MCYHQHRLQRTGSGFSVTTQSDDQDLLLATQYFCSWVAISLESCINGHYPYLEAENKSPYVTVLATNSSWKQLTGITTLTSGLMDGTKHTMFVMKMKTS